MSDIAPKGLTITMFLEDGNANGIITAETVTWTGQLVVGPRSKLQKLLPREEAGRAGVYFLLGRDPESDARMVYIGQGEIIKERLRAHGKDSKKEFFDRVCFITSKSDLFTKAHVLYLESRLISMAKESGNIQVVNSNVPDEIKLPKSEISNMETFIHYISIFLPALGMDFLRTVPGAKGSHNKDDVIFVIHNKKHDIQASATERDGVFIVLKGSESNPEWIGKEGTRPDRQNIHQTCMHNGAVEAFIDGKGNKKARFVRDETFSSPSAAGAAVLGRVCNGRKEWKEKATNKKYGDWQEEQIDKAD